MLLLVVVSRRFLRHRPSHHDKDNDNNNDNDNDDNDNDDVKDNDGKSKMLLMLLMLLLLLSLQHLVCLLLADTLRMYPLLLVLARNVYDDKDNNENSGHD